MREEELVHCRDRVAPAPWRSTMPLPPVAGRVAGALATAHRPSTRSSCRCSARTGRLAAVPDALAGPFLSRDARNGPSGWHGRSRPAVLVSSVAEETNKHSNGIGISIHLSCACQSDISPGPRGAQLWLSHRRLQHELDNCQSQAECQWTRDNDAPGPRKSVGKSAAAVAGASPMPTILS